MRAMYARRAALALSLLLLPSSLYAQADGSDDRDVPATPTAESMVRNEDPTLTEHQPPQPFGARLFMGNFLKQRNDGLNPDYTVAPGDRVAVNTWGSVEINDVFVVDGQGNIFLPRIGPVHLDGVRNAELTKVVKSSIQRVYSRNVDVYTNLITAAPVAVFVTGQVQRPGRYAGIPSDPVLFFLDQAGGIEPSTGSYRDIRVLRDGETIGDIDLYDFLVDGKFPELQLADGDTILVGPRGPTVTVQGDVAAPLIVEFKQEHFSGADALAIVHRAALATEVTVTGRRGSQAAARTLSVEDFAQLPLRDGDIVVLRTEDRTDTVLITLEGEFDSPSVLSVKRGSRLLDVLNYVEVDPTLADTSAIHLKRRSVAQSQKKAIDDSLFRLERTALLTLSQSNGEAEIRVKEAELMQQFIESARLIQPLGRVVTADGDRQLNVLLEDGDIVVIPQKTNVVRVGGEVQMTSAVMYRPGFTAGDYIRSAGGYSDRGDDDRVLVLHASAEVTVGSPDLPVRPGDEVIVPPRIDSKRLQNTMDIVQIVYQIAVAAGVAISPVIAATN